MSLQGAEGLKAAFQQLGPKIERKILGPATRKGMAIIVKEAKSRAPVLTGTMKRAITTRASKGAKRRGVTSVNLVFNTKKFPQLISFAKTKTIEKGKNKGNPKRYFYPAFIEYGTDKMVAKPFIRPAFDTRKEDAANTIIESCWAGIRKEW